MPEQSLRIQKHLHLNNVLPALVHVSGIDILRRVPLLRWIVLGQAIDASFTLCPSIGRTPLFHGLVEVVCHLYKLLKRLEKT